METQGQIYMQKEKHELQIKEITGAREIAQLEGIFVLHVADLGWISTSHLASKHLQE